MIAAVSVEESIISSILKRHSDLDKILRIVAYCFRFGGPRRLGAREVFVSHQEMAEALHVIIRGVQREMFHEEYRLLSGGGVVGGSSGVSSLSPFLDGNGIIRVGGRLKNADMSYETRHPALLPRSHDLTKLIIRREHIRNLHSGLQATLHAVQQRFWPLAARSAVRGVVRGCMRCFRCRPAASQARMADLPGSRVTVSRPFSHAGVDYAGPILVKECRRRNARTHKAYIAIFVCFATKAIHIEIVSDLTSEAFLAAFKRFISRRGRPICMYSDNGTTFVGANKQLKELRELICDAQAQPALKELLRDNEISWSFIPPHAPHFGGLWEAAVKSAKFHMHRIIGNAHLTLEETQTALYEIEAILNSRPLTPISADPNDLSCITPGHFLIGTALNSFPVPDMTEVREGHLLRWQRVEQMRQHSWRRWSAEYLHTLVERRKWRTNKGKQLEVGQLVLVQQPELGPLQWLLGRVEQTHPGKDGLVRAATLKTSKGQVTRPLTKLAILPLEGDK